MATKKVILTHEVTGLGASGDVVEVRAGYARNLLIPRGLAMPWTAGGEEHVESLRKARQAKQIADRDEAFAVREQIEAIELTIEMKAGKGGRLFGAVTPAKIAEALREKTGRDFDHRQVALAEHVKSMGKFFATVRIHDDVTARLVFEVVGKA